MAAEDLLFVFVTEMGFKSVPFSTLDSAPKRDWRREKMERKYGIWTPALTALVVMCSGASVAWAGEEIVDLSMTPSASTINVGDTVEVTLMASPGIPEALAMSGVQVILGWDPGVLRLAGSIENVLPEYDWLQSGFDNDSGLDDLNAGLFDPPTGVPGNDGDAFYSALGQLASPPVVPLAGMQVTRFLFEAIAESNGLTDITMPLTAGQFTQTAAFSATVPGLNILGDATGTQIMVVPEPATGAFLILLSTGFLRARRGERVR